jgi:hypothetical protein
MPDLTLLEKPALATLLNGYLRIEPSCYLDGSLRVLPKVNGERPERTGFRRRVKGLSMGRSVSIADADLVC